MSLSSPTARCQESDPHRDLTQAGATAVVISVRSESFSCNDVQTGADYQLCWSHYPTSHKQHKQKKDNWLRMLRGYIFTAQTNGSLKQDSAIPYYITVFKANLKINECFTGYKDRRPKFCSAIIVIYKKHKSNLHHNVSPLSLQSTL